MSDDKERKEIENEMKVLEASYEMYEASKEETRKRRNGAVDKDGNKIYTDESTNEVLNLMETMQKDVIDKYKKLGGNVEDLRGGRKSRAKKRKGLLEKLMGSIDNNAYTSPVMKKAEVDRVMDTMTEIQQEDATDSNNVVNEENVTVKTTYETPRLSSNIQYDTIPLPSKGQCYKNKIDKIPVAYLTANDENLIVSPNLYKDGLFIDYLLASKIMTNKISADEMLPGDRDAIVLWLRASGYGPIFPVQVTDPESGEQFEADADLTQIKYKPFNLKSDENGYFDFKLPKSGDDIKFRFLTYSDIKELGELEMAESKANQKGKLQLAINNIKDVLDIDDSGNKVLRSNATNALSSIEEYAKSITEEEGIFYTHAVTNKLVMSIMEINGITDRQYIYNYVSMMNVQDSSALRNYISENEPGLDFNIEIEKPKSLGGGSMPMFLSLDQYLFLNIR